MTNDKLLKKKVTTKKNKGKNKKLTVEKNKAKNSNATKHTSKTKIKARNKNINKINLVTNNMNESQNKTNKKTKKARTDGKGKAAGTMKNKSKPDAVKKGVANGKSSKQKVRKLLDNFLKNIS